jgi:hypothetical protein
VIDACPEGLVWPKEKTNSSALAAISTAIIWFREEMSETHLQAARASTSDLAEVRARNRNSLHY